MLRVLKPMPLDLGQRARNASGGGGSSLPRHRLLHMEKQRYAFVAMSVVAQSSLRLLTFIPKTNSGFLCFRFFDFGCSDVFLLLNNFA